MVAALLQILTCIGLASAAASLLREGTFHGNMKPVPAMPRVENPATGPVVSRNGTVLPPYNTTYYFDQLIDHNNPQLGTFKQRYWHTWEFYESGGPIILMTPGEINADGYANGYLSNLTINGRIAQQQNGSTIVLEHRFYGFSNPYPDLTVKSLRLHTIQQAIDDLVYFSRNVNLPMPNGNNVTPDKAPWILIGGSYSGALTSWTMVNQPGVFWAGYASSAVVEAILDFWQYFEPIREHMPANCSADVQAVIAHVDKVFTSYDTAAIDALKDSFGLGALTHLDDVAGALRNNLWDWQSLQPRTGPGAQFFQFCDALEVKDGVNAPATGWGLDHALPAWSSYFKNTYIDILCNGITFDVCFDTYNASSTLYTSTAINNNLRSWFWIVCNEVGYLQEGPPKGRPALVTRLVQPPYDLRQCSLMFPEAFPKPPTPAIQRTNTVYKGWKVRIDRLFFGNGIRDPWRDATVSAETIHVPSTTSQPIALGDGFHTSDLSYRNALVDPSIAAIQTEALSYFKKWLAEWKPTSYTRNPPTQPPQGGVAAGFSGSHVALKQAVNVQFRDPGIM